MQMIDVMKRLAELDSTNPNIVKESTVAECGMMPMGAMGGSHTPASINMSADSGPELTGMLRDIMHLAGVQPAGDVGGEPEALGIDMEPATLVAEPVAGIEEPMPSAGEKMRSVLDKLNPEPAGDGGNELGAFQGGDEMSADQGDVDNDGDHDMDDHDAEEDNEETDEGQYDNSPAGAEPTEPFDANEFAHQENQPGAGDTSSGQERQRNLPTATFENLMKEYKSFIGEAEEEETDEGIMDKAKAFGKKVLDKVGHGDDEDMIKDLQKKAGVPQTGKKPEPANESMADILKLSGLRK
jgi:hypothetical protein